MSYYEPILAELRIWPTVIEQLIAEYSAFSMAERLQILTFRSDPESVLLGTDQLIIKYVGRGLYRVKPSELYLSVRFGISYIMRGESMIRSAISRRWQIVSQGVDDPMSESESRELWRWLKSADKKALEGLPRWPWPAEE